MNKNRWLSVLMILAIMLITAFQVYWLRDNYIREKRLLSIRTGSTFNDAVSFLQAIELKLDKFPGDSSRSGNMNIIIRDSGDHSEIVKKLGPKKALMTTISALQHKFNDSVFKQYNLKGKTIVSINQTYDFIHRGQGGIPPPPNDHFYKILVDVDSLQDSLRVQEIDSACRAAFHREKIDIPFRITKNDSTPMPENAAEVTVGLTRPVNYRLQLYHTGAYLLKKISLPVLFSLLLLGITILSFILLFRNMVRQKRLSAQKNDFISNITHELKTPIATVSVAIEALQHFNALKDPDKIKEYLSLSQNELQRLSLLVDNALQFSKFEQGAIPFSPEQLNLGALTDEVIQSLKPQLDKAQATVKVNSSGDLDFYGDKLHISGALFNLLDNALKYCNKIPQIIITLSGDEQAVHFTIRDNGIGIPQEYKNKVFEKFFRVPKGDLHQTRGYGLGLSYAWQVIKQHGGTLELVPTGGEGATFVFSIPRNQHG